MVLRPTRAQVTLGVLLLVTAGTLTAAYLVKAHCGEIVWDGEQFTSYCYNDVMPLYHGRNLDEGATPYLDQADGPVSDRMDHPGFLEYPLLTGVLMAVASKLTAAGGFGWEGSFGFFRWNALLLAPFALGTTALLWRMTRDPLRTAVFAVGPPLFLYPFHNWDIMAVFFVVLAVERFEAKRYVESGAAVAVGAAAKLFPLMLAPLFFMLLWQRHHREVGAPLGVGTLYRSLVGAKDVWRFTAGVIGTLVAVHLPLLALGGGPLYVEMFRFHAERLPNFESVWYAARELLAASGGGWTYGEEGAWPTVALVVLYVGSWLWVWWKRPDARRVALVSLMPLLLTNVFFSVQYVLWVLPFFALLRLPWWLFALFVAGDLAVLTTLFPYFVDLAAGGGDYLPVARAVLFRELVFLAIFGVTLFGKARTAAVVRTEPVAPQPSVGGVPGA